MGGPLQQGLAAQATGDVPGFFDGRRSLGIVQAGEMGGVVEQAVGQMIGRALLPETVERRGERTDGRRLAVAVAVTVAVTDAVVGSEASAGEVAFGPRSISPTARTLSPDRSASSSWVSPAARRWLRSKSPKLPLGPAFIRHLPIPSACRTR